ncbi:hypothetical protein [Microcoleus sp. CAWBG58]|uniref:hypothetical protein n=1 Tax=Microcoleus sp. CAWBG58 TaxID=2841651 RepID=UPI0025D6BFA8|nr:hypothetical protein [Microcoleus sp. CAWBG58]
MSFFYQKELVESPPARSGEIKIRLFNLLLQFSDLRVEVNCQLSTVESHLSFLN